MSTQREQLEARSRDLRLMIMRLKGILKTVGRVWPSREAVYDELKWLVYEQTQVWARLEEMEDEV